VARTAIDLVLAGHEPFPAIAVDRHWKLVSANKAVGLLLAGVDQALLRQPVNALRVALHPNGLAPRTVNLAVWRAHLLARLRRQIELTADPDLIELLNELQKYPAARSAKPPSSAPPDAAVVLRRTSSVRWCVLRDRVPTSLVSSPRRLPAPRTTASSKMSDSPDEWSPTRTGGLSAEEHPQRYRVRGSLSARRLAPLLYESDRALLWADLQLASPSAPAIQWEFFGIIIRILVSTQKSVPKIVDDGKIAVAMCMMNKM
jgi:MmyB-like transcription regulator ligand binding domain